MNSNGNILVNGAQYSSPNTPLQLVGGVYGLNVVDAAGCQDTYNILVTSPDVLIVDIVSTDVTCNGEEDGTLLAVPSGGTTPYFLFFIFNV
jgi:hypothetical protein